jgi:transcriptional regulator with XRE-family HTH domain
MDDLDLEREN